MLINLNKENRGTRRCGDIKKKMKRLCAKKERLETMYIYKREKMDLKKVPSIFKQEWSKEELRYVGSRVSLASIHFIAYFGRVRVFSR